MKWQDKQSIRSSHYFLAITHKSENVTLPEGHRDGVSDQRERRVSVLSQFSCLKARFFGALRLRMTGW
jgi:hypothetical protein